MTEYGFEWKGHKIMRLCSDDKKGWVIVGVLTKKQCIEIHIPKTGKVRVFDSKAQKELK